MLVNSFINFPEAWMPVSNTPMGMFLLDNDQKLNLMLQANKRQLIMITIKPVLLNNSDNLARSSYECVFCYSIISSRSFFSE